MVLKTKSAKTPVAGPPTTVVRKPLVGTRHRAAHVLRAAPPCLSRGLSMTLVCPIKLRHFVAGPTQMRQMRHIADTKNAFSPTTSVPSVPFPDTISAHAMVHTETKARHQVSPHTTPSISMPGNDRDPGRYGDSVDTSQNLPIEYSIKPLNPQGVSLTGRGGGTGRHAILRGW